jgi:NADPH:quinone reductase-like Zn-dependent oxidoreductase
LKAVYFTQHGGTDVLKFGDFPVPTPGADDVLVRVKACALNHLDIWIRMGIPGISVPLPHILGADVAGVIDSVGANVREWIPGQKVLVSPGISCGACDPCLAGDDHLCAVFDILGQLSNGGYAEYVKVPSSTLLPFPEPLSFEEASSIPLVFLTAWHMLVTNGNIQKGQTVLIHAGGSGVGIAAIQIAKRKDARVITTVGTHEKGKKAKVLGADEVIYYRDMDFLQEVMRLTNKRGVDHVVDHIGQETFEKSLNSLARGGKLLTCGATSGRNIQFDLRTLFGKNITIHGSRMGRKKGLEEAMVLLKSGHLAPVIDSVYPLNEASLAHTHMEDKKNFGKIVLAI